jgi:hypothetical protein
LRRIAELQPAVDAVTIFAAAWLGFLIVLLIARQNRRFTPVTEWLSA